MADRSYRMAILVLAVIGLAADQATKYSVFSWLHGVESNTYAIFQTDPESRTFAEVPYESDPLLVEKQRGFFLAVAFEARPDANGKPVPQVNQGALFGFGRNYKTLANGIFAVISLLAAAAIIYWSTYKSTAQDRWLCISLGLILAGTLGNMYDRLVFNGVRDFLYWHYGFNWPVFNVADCCLVVGASLLLVQAFFQPQPAPPSQVQTEKAAVSTPV